MKKPVFAPYSVNRVGIQFVLGLLLGMILLPQAFAANCTATYTYTSTGGSANYTLNAGQSLKIVSGTYTGALDGFANGSSVCVETGATFNPSNINIIAGTLTNYGTTILQTFVYNAGAVIDNYGTLTFPGGLNTNGITTFRNRTGATMNMDYSFQLGKNSTFVNDGLLVAKQDFNTENGTTLTNNHRLELEGNFNPDGKFDNYGRVYAKAFMNINLNSDVTNYCTLVSWGGFNNNSALMDNQGTILITSAGGTPGGLWQNNKPFQNGSNAKIAGGDFTNNDSFTGGGHMIFAGFTRNNGTFTGNSSSDKITFYDETQTGSQLFDVVSVAAVNTVRAAVIRPTELDSPSNCSSSYKNFANPIVNDYGDAPASYGDAGHAIVAGIHMGTKTPDAEAASQYSFNASADGAEDDGAPHPVSPDGPATVARFPVLQANASSYSSPFTVTNTTGTAGKLYGWIDFDKSGTFEADEAASVTVPSGSSNVAVTLTWNSIPTDIKIGTTFIRLRLTTDTAVTTASPTGNASNGEVEDYPLAIYQPVPSNSVNLKIINGITPSNCQATVFSDNFNDLTHFKWGALAGGQNIRNWVRAGGGTDTYAEVEEWNTAPYYSAIYFGNGALRGVYPPIPNGFTFDADGKLTSTLTAVALRDVPDDLDVSHWGPNPVTLSTSVPTQVGKAYRLYFKAIPETDSSTEFADGIMRVDITGSTTESIHFKAPGSKAAAQDYAIEFTATAATTTVAFVNYGHVADIWCDPQTNTWCTEGGIKADLNSNELIIDDVVIAAKQDCGNDYGDAPASYGTPSHSVTTGIHLGSVAPDTESSAQPNATASGDDNNGVDDEGGINIPAMTQGQTATLTAVVTGASGYLQGWIDFNGDGDFTDTGEQIATNVQDNGASDSNAGADTIGITVNVPATATTNPTYARFRWSTAINLDSTSAAANGEVEDYTLTIASAPCSLIVTTTADTDNANNNSGSLRDAMECANNRAGGDTITFNMPTTEAGYNATTGVWTIKPLSPLPVLSGDSTYIDATSQAGANCGDWWAGSRILKVQLDGAGLSATTDGLVVEGDNFALRGMSITRFPQNGISFKTGADNALIACDHLGVAADGITSGSNKTGLSLAGTAILVGGMTAGDANVIAHNTEQGVSLPNSAGQVILMRNSIHANGKLGIDLGVDNVTVNDANDTDSGANQLLNLPILNQVIVGTGDITVRGCAPAGATLELFEADVSTGGSATPGDNQLGRTKDYGEGQRYLASFAENSAADIDAGNCALPPFDTHDNTGMKAFQLTLPLPANVAVGDKLTATAMLGSAGTSEFGPVIITEGGPPTAGGGSCAATGGTDILFIVDNSGSITPDEYADFAKTIQTVGTQLLADNPANRIGVAHFGGPTDSLVSGGQYVYFERDFSTAAMAAPVRQFGTNGAYNVNWWADHLAGAVQQIRYAIDGNTATSSSYIVSPLREMSRTTASPLQIVLMTDAVRYGDWVPSDISMLIDPPGSGAEPNDGSDFTVYNQLKADGIAFSVVSFNPNPVDIAASAAIASVGGTYTGVIDPNPQDPDGSQTTPRRYISVTSGFQLTATQVEELVEGTAICSSAISGLVFEDFNYGGGAARPASEAGTVGITNATVEIYDSTGKYLAQTTTDADGIYKLPNLPDGKYYLRAVSDSVNSSRAGSNGTEIPVPTYPVIGGVKAAAADASINPGSSNLNTSNFIFTGGVLNGQQAQAVQAATLTGNSLKNVDFGFNFDTIVNANDNGQGSLRQFLLNANLLGNDSALTQSGLIAGKENAILMLPTTDPNYDSTGKYWSIKLQSALPDIIAPMVLDSSRQTGFTSTPLLELNGNNAGSSSHGLTLAAGSDGSSIRYLSITRFAGDGIAVTGNSKGNSLLSNNIYNNGGLGIDLGNDGVSNNDAGDTDSGANNLLNYPEVKTSSFGTNGSRIISYDFNLDLPANTSGYRLEFFKNIAKDPSGNGEGQTFIGSKDFSHPGGGTLNFKGTFNANQAVTTSDFISVTVTEKTGATTFGSTSEFSGSANNNNVVVCTSLIDNPGSALPDMMIDENATGITLLQTKDSSGNPVTYAITGGADSSMFTVGPVSGGTTDCAQIQFVKTLITKDASVNPRALPPGMIDPGDFEVPVDKDKDNAYDLAITATDSTGQKYARTLRVRVMDVNEAPIITSSNTVSVTEDTSTLALDIKSQDPDSGDTEGNGLSYAISGGTDQNIFALDSSSGILNFKAIPDYDAPMDSNRDNSYEIAVTVTDHGGLTASKTFNIAVQNQTGDDGVKLQARVLLQGAYDSKTGLMSDTLNTLKLLPANQPYQSAPFNHSGTETISALVNSNTGNQSIVDWVLLDLRSSSKTTLSTRAVLVQRDGNLVDAQTGTTTLNFAGISAGNYYVSVRHRNHLGVMTASPVSLGSTATLVDFSLASTSVAGSETRYTSGKLALLWVGDINASSTLTCNGPGNDITNLLSTVLSSTENPQAYTNYILQGYLNTDINMDGKTLFSGPNNDANTLLGNVLLHPLNSTFAANYIVRGGLQ
ncbi:MAG: VWA domain-containing protein [Candidatus Thiothrix moscowensis]|nr:VWA domain-containing protein [Candidatus Thiothrix moscowensis]